ncbi:MAG: hypothetical protein AABZ74_14545 [Cyanobacteriota bacterium]|mgnify:CR=1 FL=1
MIKIKAILIILLFNMFLFTSNSYSNDENNNEYDNKIIDLKDKLKKTKDTTPKKLDLELEKLFENAKLFYENKDFSSSIDEYIKILYIDPLNEKAYLEIKNISKEYASELKKQNKEDEIAEKLEPVINLGIYNLKSENKNPFYLSQSNKYFENRDFEKAIFLLKKVNGSDFEKEEANQLLLKSYMALGSRLALDVVEIEKIEDEKEREVMLDKKLLDVKYTFENANLIVQKLKQKPKNIATTKAFINDMLELAYANFCEKFRVEENFKEALNEANKLLKRNKNNFEGIYTKALSEFDLGNHNEGINFLIKAIKLKPNDHTSHYNLAFFYTATNKPNLAIEQIEEVIKLRPDLKNYIKNDKRFNNLKNNSKFQKLLK